MFRLIVGLTLFCCSFQAFSTSHPKQLERCEVSIFDPTNQFVDKFTHTCGQIYGKQLQYGTIHVVSKNNEGSVVQVDFHEPIGYCSAVLKNKLFTCVTSNEYLVTLEVKLAY